MKKYLLNSLTILMVAFLSVSVSSCSDDDDDNGNASSMSESQIRELLESGSGQWSIRENDEGEVLTFTWIFKNGKIYDGEYDTKGATYSVTNGFLKLISYPSWDFLDGGYVITKIEEKTMSGYWQGNKSNTFTGIKK